MMHRPDIAAIVRIAEHAKELPTYPDSRFPVALYYKFLRALCEYVHAECCVELGVCGGGGSLHMCIGTPGVVIGVDRANAYPDRVAYVESQFDNFTFYQMDSVEAAEFLRCTIPDVDVLFIDTVHTYAQVTAELVAWRPLLANDAVICLDDLNVLGNVWAEMPEPKISIEWLHPGSGFGVAVRGGDSTVGD